MDQDALTWIPTKGNDIPPLAVPLHVGSDGQLYVARAVLDGEIYIGTTSYSSSRGACIRDRRGQDHDVFEYEVLTCASSMRFVLASGVETARRTPTTPGKLTPLSWPSPLHSQPTHTPNETRGKEHQNALSPYGPKGSHSVQLPNRPSPISLSRKEAVQFRHLAQSRCFIVIDDTPSMQQSWTQTREALRGIVKRLSSERQWEGLNVRFLNHGESRPCVRTVAEFDQVFKSVTLWRGDKVMTQKVSQVLVEGFSVIHEKPNPKPVVLLIVTDALATDARELQNEIIRFSQALSETHVPTHMFRIFLLQMGDDRNAIDPLHDLRDRINQQERERRILNVVSYHRGRGLLNSQHIIKLLLASTHIPVEEDPNIGERLPPKVIAAQHQEVENIRRIGKR